MKNIGTTIRLIRKFKKINQKDFAKIVKRDRAFLTRIELNKKSPSPETFERILFALEISPTAFFLLHFSKEEFDLAFKQLQGDFLPLYQEIYSLN